MHSPGRGARSENTMHVEAILAELETRGVELRAAGDRLQFRPVEAVPPELVEEIRAHKAELLRRLPPGAVFSCFDRKGWPPESIDAEQRFGQWHARLYPFLGKTVATPAGPGRLVQVPGWIV
ncbi:MAG TPA: hypothetical protein VHQ90_08915 [Thermoanaerobaculia bacterium]|nr:hypothetical protein [Thermoanaerobaculia bacterium]